MRCASLLALSLLLGCTVDRVDDLRFACDSDRDCREGWICLDGICDPGPRPDGAMDATPEEDMTARDADAVDAGRPMDMAPRDLDPPPGDMTAADVQPVDQAVPVDMAPVDDRDDDGIPDDADNCVDTPNPAQRDTDGDSLGDACDPDDDDDGVLDVQDNCRQIQNAGQADQNANGIGDRCECDAPGPCRVLLAGRCEANLVCDGQVLYDGASGECVDGRCVDPVIELVDAQRCLDERCVDGGQDGARCLPAMACMGGPAFDRDGDGLPDVDDNCPDHVNPRQRDQDQDGVGDACDYDCDADADCRERAVSRGCEDGAEALCGGAVLAVRQEARCLMGQCVVEDVRRPCPATERCVVGEVGAACQPDAECAAADACVLERDGEPCRLGPGRPEAARCVAGVCRAWTCTRAACNESGPRYGRGEALVLEGVDADMDGLVERVVDRTTTLEWRTALTDALDLDDAHAACAALPGEDWRLPSIWELLTLVPRSPADRLALANAFGAVPGRLRTRTVGPAAQAPEVMVVALDSGAIGPASVDALAPGLCVREPEPIIKDLAARRAAFAEGLPVADPWTGVTWHERFLNLRQPAATVDVTCSVVFGRRAPTIPEAYSIMGWTAARAPGLWTEWDGQRLGAMPESWWTGDRAGVRRWIVLDDGSNTLVGDGTHGYYCVIPPN